MALPTSSALPPPAATTRSQPASRRTARPRSTVASDGSASTSAKTRTATPAASSDPRSPSSAPDACSAVRPQTISACLPIGAACLPSWLRTPGPKKISLALRIAISLMVGILLGNPPGEFLRGARSLLVRQAGG